MKAQTVKGFKDYLPEDALKRQFVVGKIIQVFEKFGFDPLETPTLEYEETLVGKYGEEEKLIYRFETPGGDKVALKYDQTVPLARVIAQYGPKGQQILPIPFKRYQIQPAYRGENPQKGRFREFLQCDLDIIGISSALADAEILAVVYEIYKNLGLDVIIKVNDRSLMKDVKPKYLSAIDKLNKIGKEKVVEEICNKGLDQKEALALFEKITNLKESDNLIDIITTFSSMGYPAGKVLEFDPTLVRGLAYYTGMIIEVVLEDDPQGSSVGGGGRYDKMIGSFIGENIPAVGFSVGLDRTIEAMEQAGVMNISPTKSQILVTIFSKELADRSVEIASKLRANDINCEVWLNSEDKLEKQLKYADRKRIPYIVVIGPEEVKKDVITLKNLDARTQKALKIDQLIERIKATTPTPTPGVG